MLENCTDLLGSTIGHLVICKIIAKRALFVRVSDYRQNSKVSFHHTVFTPRPKVRSGRDLALALSVEGMMKNSIHNTASKKECLNSHVL